MPVTFVWLTGVNGTYTPRATVAVSPWLTKSGAYSVGPTATNVPQSPGIVVGG